MREAAENGKESSHSAHGNRTNEWMRNKIILSWKSYIVLSDGCIYNLSVSAVVMLAQYDVQFVLGQPPRRWCSGVETCWSSAVKNGAVICWSVVHLLVHHTAG
jgi:hypothetical protein